MKPKSQGVPRSFVSRRNSRSAAGASLAAMALTGLALIGCGGAKFERAAGAPKFRALPMGTSVTAQDGVEGLATPVVVLGTIKIDTKSKTETPDTDGAIATLKQQAARFGCDAVIGAASTATKKIFKKKHKSLGADGRPVYKIEEKLVWTHHWKAQCVRTAKAPKEVKLRRDKYGRLRPVNGGASAGSTTGATTGATSKPASTTPAPTHKDKHSGKSKNGRKSEQKSASTAASALPAMTGGDPKMASEVARAFLTFSRYAASGNATMLCKMLDSERVYFDIRTKNPRHAFKKDLSGKKACASMMKGELAGYLRDFGPAEVHTEIPTLIPSLFRIHGGAYLKLDEAHEASYRTKLVASRKGKKPLRCEMYTVLPAGNLYKVMLDCQGVRSYRLLLRRDGTNDFKLMALTHVR